MNNAVMLQAFEWNTNGDGYYRFLSRVAKTLASRGIDAVWLPPVYKATSKDDVGYGVYDLYDLGEFDQKGSISTKYGTKEELIDCINALHDAGILVYADVVLNHKAAADNLEKFMAIEVNPDNRLEDISEPIEIEGWTSFTFDGRNNKYSDFKWNFNHFTGVDYDNKTGKTAIYRILGDGKYWSDKVSNEFGNFDYLMFADIDHKHPDVKNELFKWAKWFVDETGVDGFRMDAVKHIDADFMEEFCNYCQNTFGDNFYIFGEYWQGDINSNEWYLSETSYKTDIFDVGLHFNMLNASKNPNYDLRQIFDNTLMKENPLNTVTFVDNHDSQPNQSLESWIDEAFKERAYSIILLRHDGYPCIFAGDYWGLNDQSKENSIKTDIDKLMLIRKSLAYGDETDYLESDKCIAWVRHGDENHPNKLVTIISTGGINQIKCDLGKENAGKTFIDYLENNNCTVITDENGCALFPVAENSVSCWAEKGLDLEDIVED